MVGFNFHLAIFRIHPFVLGVHSCKMPKNLGYGET